MAWVILAVIAVALVAAWIVMRRRSTATEGRPEEPAAVAAPADRPAEAAPEPVEAGAAISVPEEQAASAVAAGADRQEREVEPAAPAEEGEVSAEAEPGIEAPPKVEPPAESPRTQVETQLDESARLLDELRAAASEAEEGSPLNAESVEIMEEGLQEIRTLAERKQWGQARDKGKALHAQLTLLLQSARRENSP